MISFRNLFSRPKSYPAPSIIRYSSGQIRKPPIRESVIRSSIRSLVFGPPRRRDQRSTLKKPVQQKPEPPAGLFGSKDLVSRDTAKWYFKHKASKKIPGTSFKYDTRAKREKVLTEFAQKYGLGKSGSFYGPKAKRALDKMKKDIEKMRPKTQKEYEFKKEFKRRREYLAREFFGEKKQ